MGLVEIGHHSVGPGSPCFIIAEAGVNHNGDVESARRLVDVAVEAGADAVKFQTFHAGKLASIDAPKAEYQLQTTPDAESQLEMLRGLELSPQAHRELQAYCAERGVLFMSTPFDNESADLLDELKVPVFKIGSGEITNWPLLEHVAAKGKPLILSTGMSYLSEVDEAVRVIRGLGCDQLILLHCVTNYPAEPADANLRAMQTMAMAFDVPVGYSDHTLGINVPVAAVALGACVIEKHFTLDRTLPGPDQAASLEPNEFSAMVAGIRTVEAALGQAKKEPSPSEMANRRIARRSLAASVDIPAGSVLERHTLTTLRPATGIQPPVLEEILGLRVIRPLNAGQILEWGHLV